MAKRRKNVDLPNNVRGVLARNLEVIMAKVPALGSQPKIAGKGKLAPSSVGRAFRAEVAVNIDSLEGLAEAANLEPWQMLVPGLDPLNPPKLEGSGSERELLEKIRNIVAHKPVEIVQPPEPVSSTLPRNKVPTSDAKTKRRTA